MVWIILIMQKFSNDLTVVISTRNRVQILTSALDFLVNLKTRNDLIREIIIVNDCSDDETARVVKDQFEGVRLITTPERAGIPKARNLGANEAETDYLWFLDDDGLPETQSLPYLVEYLTQHKKVAAVGYEVVEVNGDMSAVKEKADRANTPSPVKIQPKPHYTFCGGAVLVSRCAFIEAGMYPEGFFYSGEEDDLSARLFSRGYRVMKSENAKFYHLKLNEVNSTPINKFRKNYYYFRNRHLFFWRNFPAIKAARESFLSSVGGFARTIFKTTFPSFVFGTFAGLLKIPRLILTTSSILQGDLYESYERLYIGEESGLIDRITSLLSDLVKPGSEFPLF